MEHFGRLAIVSVAFAVAIVLQGCGGGGGGPAPTPAPTPPPTTTTTTPYRSWVPCGPDSKACCNPHTFPPQTCAGSTPPTPCQECGGGDACQCEDWVPPPTPPPPPAPPDTTRLNVITYNLFWWCTSDEYTTCPQYAGGAGFNALAANVEHAFPQTKDHIGVDLIGFQECDDITEILPRAGLDKRMDYYKPKADGPMAWDKNRFTKLASGQKKVAADKYGDRYMNWVRLKEAGSGRTYFFANTHGPLNGCGADLGHNYLDAINAHKGESDKFVMTGDFNCGPNTDAMRTLSANYNMAATSGPLGGCDHILVDQFGTPTLSEKHINGVPSDHSLLMAAFDTSATRSSATNASRSTAMDLVV